MDFHSTIFARLFPIMHNRVLRSINSNLAISRMRTAYGWKLCAFHGVDKWNQLYSHIEFALCIQPSIKISTNINEIIKENLTLHFRSSFISKFLMNKFYIYKFRGKLCSRLIVFLAVGYIKKQLIKLNCGKNYLN